MRAKKSLTDKNFQAIGQRYASEDVATETSEASARWARDVEGLALAGFGPEALAEFEALRSQHAALRTARPAAVAAKKNAVQNRDRHVSAGWAWVDLSSGILGRIARSDAAVATELASALPSDDSELGDGIGAMAALLTRYQDRVPASAKVADRIAESAGLIAALSDAPGQLAEAKAAPVADTAEIDVIDGKLYMTTRDLYDAGRKAARNGRIASRPSDYTFKHLNQGGRAASPSAPNVPPDPIVTA